MVVVSQMLIVGASKQCSTCRASGTVYHTGLHTELPVFTVSEQFAHDLTEAIEYAKNPPSPMPRSGAMYGAGGAIPDRDEMLVSIADRLDAMHEVGPKE